MAAAVDGGGDGPAAQTGGVGVLEEGKDGAGIGEAGVEPGGLGGAGQGDGHPLVQGAEIIGRGGGRHDGVGGARDAVGVFPTVSTGT